MKYLSSGAFRRALEQRLLAQSLQSGVPLVRLRKMVVGWIKKTGHERGYK